MRRVLTNILVIYVCVLGALLSFAASAQTTIRVLAYPFPPFLNEDLKTGLTPELLDLFNLIQDDFDFQLYVTKPEERYENLLDGKQDMILFEMPKWSWDNKKDKVKFTRQLMKGGEVYVAKRGKQPQYELFETVTSRHIAAYQGYHYAFADYNSDRKWLKENFKISFANSHYEIMDLVRDNKAEVGVVTLSFLKRYFIEKPEQIAEFEVSENFAQVYDLKAVIRKNAPISVKEFELVLTKLKKDFVLQKFLEKNGIIRQWSF